MNNKLDNQALKEVMKIIYDERQSLPHNQEIFLRKERTEDNWFCEIWFMTLGCSHDRKGGCTMCNYGKGYMVEFESIINKLENEIDNLPSNIEELIITPSGSMLSDEEVPDKLREKIYKMINKISTKNFIIEARVDDITEEKLKILSRTVKCNSIYIEIGVEAYDNFIMKHCVNKHLTIQKCQDVIRLAHKYGVKIIANIGIGIPFLNEKTGIQIAKQSIENLLRDGADSVVLFPYHIKPGTLSEVLYKEGLYDTISLWSFIEVLASVKEKDRSRVQISWYRNYYDNKKKIIKSPTTCAICEEKVLNLLDEYKNRPSTNVIKKITSLSCNCHVKWKQNIEEKIIKININDIIEKHEMLYKKYNISLDKQKIALQTIIEDYSKKEDI